jgi:hypothetical protein
LLAIRPRDVAMVERRLADVEKALAIKEAGMRNPS